MSLPWVRLDSHYYANPKVLTLAATGKHRALHLYVCALAYCGGTGSDGFVPREALAVFLAKPADAKDLCAAGMWHEVPGGWEVNDWHDFQLTSEEHQKRRDKAKKAAETRWNKAQGEAVLKAVKS